MAQDSCSELVARCFAARTAAHMAHLRTRSYAQHVALQEFYEGIEAATDAFAEAYMGCSGVFDEFPSVPVPRTEPLPFIMALSAWLRENRDKCAEGHTELENLIDELLQVCSVAKYKLRTLK
jgi:hypothetical protein